MQSQETSLEPEAFGPDIQLKYHLVADGDPQNPSYDLDALDAVSKNHLKKNPGGKPPTIEFPFGSEWYEISIKLKDNTGGRLRFNVGRPVDAHESLSCPAQFSGIKTDQFKMVCAKSSELQIVNSNEKEGEIYYSLNLVDRNGKDIERFDPIFQNAGGGNGRFM